MKSTLFYLEMIVVALTTIMIWLSEWLYGVISSLAVGFITRVYGLERLE